MNIYGKIIDRGTRKALNSDLFEGKDPTTCESYREYRIVVRAIIREDLLKPVKKSKLEFGKESLYDKIWKSADKYILRY